MNKELAIECIKTQRQFVDDTTREAFEMAIEALESENSDVPDNNVGKMSEVESQESEGVYAESNN